MQANASVLIVDDEELNLKVLSRFVGSLGCEAHCVSNGVDALRIVRERPVDLILLDIMMPQVDGFHVLTRLKSDPTTMGIPVLVVSAYDDSSNVVRCIEAGADDFMTKPFNSHLLKARVRSCLSKRRHLEKEEEYCKEVEANNLRLEQFTEERIAPIAESKRRISLIQSAQETLMRRLVLLTDGHLPDKSTLLSWIRNAPDAAPTTTCSDEHRQAIAEIGKYSLLYAELAANADSFSKRTANVTATLNDSIRSTQEAASKRRVTIRPLPQIAFNVVGDRELLTYAFEIFLAKAIEWCAESSSVEVLFEVSNQRLVTLFHSQGLYIPRDRLQAIFDLRRRENERVPGPELAPSVARTIIELFGGQVVLDSMDDGIFQMIELPVHVSTN